MKSLLAALLLLVSSSAYANLVKYDGDPPGFWIITGANVMGYIFEAVPILDETHPQPVYIPNLVKIEALLFFNIVDFYDPNKTYPSDAIFWPGILYGQDAIQYQDSVLLTIYGNQGGSGGYIDYTDGARWGGYGIISYYLDEPSVVPLPATLPLMLSGLGVIGFLTRRRY